MFVFKQKTAYELRISDWSSDVCSSDLTPPRRHGAAGRCDAAFLPVADRERSSVDVAEVPLTARSLFPFPFSLHRPQRPMTRGFPVKKWFKTLAATCAVIPFAQCAMAPGGNIASAAEPAKATATPVAVTDADPALWVVKDEDTTIYLFGTVHVLKPGLGWFDEAVKTAFDASDQLMLELVMPEDQAEAAKVMMPLAIDRSGKTLSSRLNPEQLAAYQAAMASVGLPAAQFDMFEPWFPAITLSVLQLTKLEIGSASCRERVCKYVEISGVAVQLKKK